MKIVLLRHGRPDVSAPEKMSANHLAQWIESYNSSGLLTEQPPPGDAIDIARTCAVVACSDLPRSIQSAKALGIPEIALVDALFREAGLPYANFPFPKMRPAAWAAFFRILWLFGYSANSESIRDAGSRAAAGATRLQEAAMINGSVLLVGHGFINRFIARQLLASGWKGPGNPGRRYWEYGVYSRH